MAYMRTWEIFFANVPEISQLLLVGTFWFWIFLGVVFAVVTILEEFEKAGWAFFALVLGCGIMHLCGNADILGYAWHHPLWVLGWVISYFAGGVLWSMVKWRSYCRNQREKYNDLKEAWLESKGVRGSKRVPGRLVPEWEAFLKKKEGSCWGNSSIAGMEMTLEEVKADEGPRFRNHKGRCLNWMCYWPCSAVWTMFNDPVRKLFRQAMTSLKGVYESIAKNSFAGVSDDFAIEETEGCDPSGFEKPDRKPLGPSGEPFMAPIEPPVLKPVSETRTR